MDYSKIINEIEKVKHFRKVKCPTCGQSNRVHALQIYTTCQACRSKTKLRGFSAVGSEIEDVIDCVLEWMGEGAEFEAVMSRYKEIRSQELAQ